MRKWLPLLGLLLLGSTSHAQIVTLFQEDFDGATVNMTSETVDKIGGPTVTGGWSINTSLTVSNPNSYHAQRAANKSKILYTDFFSTSGLTSVRLEFDHIAKLDVVHKGWVEYSVDSGQTWHNVMDTTPSPYLGTSIGYPSTKYYNATSYADPSGTPYWQPGANVAPSNTWWVHETYDLSLSTISATTTPYDYVQIRWNCDDGNPNPIWVSHAGWWIDNIEVTGATCELQPPTITWSNSNNRQPTGPRYQLSQEVNLDAADAGSGLDSVLLFYSINGGPEDTVLMTPNTAGSCPLASGYSYFISGLNVGDTVVWRVEVTDCACPNLTTFPDPAAPNRYAKFWMDPPPPAKCGPTSVTSWPYIIANMPWTENFENPNLWVAGSGSGDAGNTHRGTWPLGNPPVGRNWQVSPLPNVAGYGWSVRTGATGTANTGPTGDHTSGNGKYLYTEASQGTSNVNTSMLITPCVDLPATTCAVLEFSYHMYGSDLDVQLPGVLRVDVDTSTGTTPGQYINGKYILVGQKQTSSNSAWGTALVPLEEFAGQTVNFRLLGVKRTPGTKQDIAIDDVKIYEPDPVDMEMVSFVDPINGLCSYSNAEDVEMIIRSKGCLAQDSIPIGYSVSLNGGAPVYHTDLITDTLELGGTLQRVYIPKANLSAYGTYEIYAYVDMPGDADNDNDTIGPLIIEHVQPITTYPYVMTFDDPSWVYGNGTINNPGTFPNDDWEQLPTHASANVGFVLGREVTEDFNTGPRRDFSNFGQYLYTDSRTVGINLSRFEQRRCVDLTALTNPNISFWYHMYGANIDFLKVQVQVDGQLAWADIAGGTLTTTPLQQTHERNEWRYQSVDLTPYAGMIVRLRFLIKTKGTSNATDAAIDNIMIWDEDGQTDVGAAYITSPNVVNTTTNPVTMPQVKVYVQNYGEAAVSNIPVNVTITDACDPSQTQTLTYTYPGPLAAHSGVEVTFPNTPTSYPLGRFSILAWTSIAGDANGYNDSILDYGTLFRFLPVPFTDNFDSCGFDTKGWFAQGGLEAWEHGTPNKGSGWNAAFSTPNSWNLANNFDYQNQNEYLRVPPLTEFDTVVGAILRFRHRFQFNNTDGGRLEYFQGGAWQQFGFSSSQVGVNWYGNAGVAAFGNEEAWTGSQPWSISEFPLLVWNMSSNPLRMRYAMQATTGSNGNTGWSIDDFQVIVPPQNSVSPIFGDTREYLIVPNDSATIYCKVENTGEKSLLEAQIRYRVISASGAGPWMPYEVVKPNPGSGPWYKGRVITFEFDRRTDPLAPGQHTIEIETYKPVSLFDSIPKNDNRPADDFFSFTVDVLQDVTPTRDSSNYCNDFEDPSLTPLVALHSFNKNRDQDWEFGTPNHPNLSGTHSGSNAWATRLDSNYHNLTESSLHSPFFNLVPDSTYKLEFWHQMKSEQYHDGGGIEFSFNGGLSWYALGQKGTTTNWYNTSHVTSLDRLKGGWTGDFTWEHAFITFQVDTPGTAVFRWRFAADYTVDGAGWVIDDFCFNLTSESPMTGPISVKELEPIAISFVELYPNPADEYTNLNMVVAQNGDANLKVTNLLGQTIMDRSETVMEGKNSITIETRDFTPGVYVLTVELNGEVSTQKFIVTR